jgi:spore maturation protein CgeB
MVGMEFDYGDESRGHSYDYKNIYSSLQILAEQGQFELKFFDYMAKLAQNNRSELHQDLGKFINDYKPDLVLFSFYTDQIDVDFVAELGGFSRKNRYELKVQASTVGLFYDDNWRRDYTIQFAKVLTAFTTTDPYGEIIYKSLGLQNSIYMGYGYSPREYAKLNISYQYDVSFVGAANSTRRWIVDYLRKNQINVNTFGFGWPSGPISQKQMVEVFNSSRINLNLSNSALSDIRYVLSGPRALLNYLRSPKRVEQLKGRHVEINACGGFQLSFYADGIQDLYQIDQEIAIYQNIDDLVGKIQFYLKHDSTREKLARQGYEKTVNHYTFGQRLQYLFAEVQRIQEKP